MDTELIKKNLKTKWLGKKINYLASVDSTNTWAAWAGKMRGELFAADFQSAGHGRMGTKWESPTGKNILASFIDTPPPRISEAPQMTPAAGLAVADALKSLFPKLNISLKWPNDILVSGKKLGGILCQLQSPWVVVGLGLNVNSKKEELSPEVAESATSLIDQMGKPQSREEILAAVLNSYEKWREIFEKKGYDEIVKEWNKWNNAGRE